MVLTGKTIAVETDGYKNPTLHTQMLQHSANVAVRFAAYKSYPLVQSVFIHFLSERSILELRQMPEFADCLIVEPARLKTFKIIRPVECNCLMAGCPKHHRGSLEIP